MSGVPIDTIAGWLAADGHLVDRIAVIGAPLAQEISGACIDSRLVRPGDLFVALPGERTDGHEFVDHAVQSGAVCALVAADRLARLRPRVYGSVHLFPVDDTLAALQSLSLRWRRRFPGLTRVGVTGSNGKTTTKEMISGILSLVAPTVSSRGNYNSDIGLPIELLRIRSHHRYGVFEMGMNRPGEISLLAGLVEPDVGLITNIGRAHVGMVGSEDDIAREKRAIYSRFTGEQIAVVPAGDRYAEVLARDVNGQVIRYDMETAGITSVETRGIDGSRLHCAEGVIDLRLPGGPMVTNAIAAMTVVRQLDAPFECIRDGLEQLTPVFGRLEILRGEVTLIRDCYNANPESMRPALDLLASSPTRGRRVAILGAMKELGDHSATAHRELVRYLRELGLDVVWLVGDEFADLEEDGVAGETRVFGYDQWQDLVSAAGELRSGDVVLLKGSRALSLERLTPVVCKSEAMT